MSDFTLSESDKAQNLWLRLKDHFVDRLAYARTRNDNPLLSEQDTAALRGEIKTLKGLIALGDDRPIVTGNEE